MIRYTTGNLLESDADALVNTVNTVGVMGKGIALQFAEAFPQNLKAYEQACAKGALEPGLLLSVKEHTVTGDKWVINFPTKTEWYRKSSYSYVEKGLVALRQELVAKEIHSVALPPLGCGNGGLDWARVRLLIETHLNGMDVDIIVYAPSTERVVTPPKKTEVNLTPARIMLLHAMFAYERSGEYSSPFVATKLAYFLQRMGEPFKLEFKAHHYGPYAEKLRHMLYDLNGVYLTGMDQKSARPFDVLHLNHARAGEVAEAVRTKLDYAQQDRLNRLQQLIDGFQSPFSLEVLASVAFVLEQHPAFSVAEVTHAIHHWSERKRHQMTAGHVRIAYEHLKQYADLAQLSN
ncbi:MAG: macro domain-containing protein [Flavobacteriales bacterium]|nr:macro domain-containing protein [Flavobacteriales bacterium]